MLTAYSRELVTNNAHGLAVSCEELTMRRLAIAPVASLALQVVACSGGLTRETQGLRLDLVIIRRPLA